MSRMAIHLSVHNHPITDGKCWESVKETRRLIAEDVDCMLNAKFFMISLIVSNTLSAS
jgi:hypothetical protein